MKDLTVGLSEDNLYRFADFMGCLSIAFVRAALRGDDLTGTYGWIHQHEYRQCFTQSLQRSDWGRG